MKPLTVEREQAGTRLDVALFSLEPRFSRSAWQTLIKDGRVKRNGHPAKRASALVKSGDRLDVDLPAKPPQPPDVAVLYQDEDVVVFDKPAGLLSHAKGPISAEWTLADIARPLVDDEGDRPGIVHRLDRATSGVIIVARSNRAKQLLQRQFASRAVDKVYLALVRGRVENPHFIIDLPLARGVKRPASFSVQPSGKPAVTEVNVLAQAPPATLVELRPKTGRTHQLRVHLSQIGHPILGDTIYGGPKETAEERLYLHAYRLGLILPSGERKTFTAEPPADFKTGVKRLGLD